MAFDPDKFLNKQQTETKETVPFDPDAFLAAASVREDVAKQQLSSFDYIANQAKLGLTDTAVLGEAIIDTFVTDPFKMLYQDITGQSRKTLSSLVTGEDKTPKGIGQRFSSNVERLQKITSGITGADPKAKAPGIMTQFGGDVARMVTDPFGFIGAPVKTAKTGVETLTNIAQPLAIRAAQLTGVGATTSLGGAGGAAIEKSLTGEDTGAGRAIGSTVAALKGAPSAVVFGQTIAAPIDILKQLYTKYKDVKANPQVAAQSYATGAAKNFLENISKGFSAEKIDDIVDDYNRISQSINKDNLPLMVAMSDNPLVKTKVAELVKTNPEVRKRFETELSTLAQNIDDRADLIFGSRYLPVSSIDAVSAKNVIKKRQEVDTAIDNLSQKFVPTDRQENLGTAISNLVEARQKLAKQEIAPVYTKIMEDAKKAGAAMPDTAVRDVYNFVVANNIRDIFGKGTAVDKQIMNVFSPQNGSFFPASFEQVDSLKRRINELQRGRLAPNEARKLDQLEDVVNASREQIPGNFNQRLIDTDKIYYEKVGVPYSAQGIKDIDAKKYADEIAPVIVKNSSALKQFLNVSGAAGPEIARNALLSEMYTKTFKDGVLDSKAMQSFLNKKADVINQVPGLRDEIRKASTDVAYLKTQRKLLDESAKAAEKEIADNFVLSVKDSKGVAVPDYRSVATRMLRDPGFYSKVNKDIGMLDTRSAKAVRNNIRSEIVDLARTNPDGGIAFLTDPRNKKTIEGVFGPGYQGAVKDLVKLSDALVKADVTKLAPTVAATQLDPLGSRIGGLDIPYLVSQIRDRISSGVQRVVRVASRVGTAQLKTATDKALADLLIDRDGLEKLRNSVGKDFTLSNPISIQKAYGVLEELMPLYLYGAAKESLLQDMSPDVPKETVMGGFEEQAPFSIDIRGVGQGE
jgi:spore coat protein CotF